MTVLILGEEYDPTVDRVVLTLEALGIPVFRADLGWFPQRLMMDAELSEDGQWSGHLRTSEREVRLDRLRSVWCRSPTVSDFPGDLSRARRQHVEREARLGVGGVLSTLPVLWMNHPQRDADHAYKPRQLAHAARCGLEIPRTLVTNQPGAVRRFEADARHGLVIKVLGSNILHEDGQRKFAATCRLPPPALTGAPTMTHLTTPWRKFHHRSRIECAPSCPRQV